MPHLEHLPGLSLVISECIGQLYFFAVSLLQLLHLQEVVLQSHFPFAQPHFVQLHLLVSGFFVVSFVCAETDRNKMVTKAINNNLIDFI
jgi:hypothetical protein